MAGSTKPEKPMLSGTDVMSDEHYCSTSKDSSTIVGTTSGLFSLNDNLDSSKRHRQPYIINLSDLQYEKTVDEVIFELPKTALEQKISDSKRIHPSAVGIYKKHGQLVKYENTNGHLLKSGQLGMCDDPYCTICPTSYCLMLHKKHSLAPDLFHAKFSYGLEEHPKSCMKRIFSILETCTPKVMNPHAKAIQKWNKFFVVSCLFAIFLDPSFFFILSVQMVGNCITLNWNMTWTLVLLRSMTDFIYFLHILLQFRLAYVAPESRVVGTGDLVDDPKMIARNYARGYFLLDFFAALPLPQIIILFILPGSFRSSANEAKNFLRAAILFQYAPRLYRFLPLLAGQSPTGFIFESAWSNFVINLLMYMLASHVVGSCWYLFGLQRVNQCFRNACHQDETKISDCIKHIDCSRASDDLRNEWQNNANATACFSQSAFEYGIYQTAVNLTTEGLLTRYIYSLFWGFQQISTLAGNQIPSTFVWEVLFIIAIIGVGLLLFALLIGNMNHFLQALGRRRLDMTLRRSDVEQWMKHRRLPEELRRRVREAERFAWAATQGISEEMLMENLPEDLQRDIRRHLFKFIKKVRIFQFLDERVIEAICERLRTKTYIKGSKIIVPGAPIDKMVFIIRGKMESIVEDLTMIPLSKGDVYGEELFTWFLEQSSLNKDGKRIRIPGHQLLSHRTVRCLTNVEAFILRAADLEEVTGLFARSLLCPRIQRAIRYESPYWRELAARRIQVAWRYRKKKQSRPSLSPLLSFRR